MKNIRGLLVNQIIHDFKQIAASIKAREQKFVGISLHESVKPGPRKSHANISFAHLVFERGLMEQVSSEHYESIAPPDGFYKQTEKIDIKKQRSNP
ncbi:MAG: hypothetical protein Pg6C_14880 [Treponemataceae bacterium]|nr:MAG: hypothetical protein Pg6C_14880 [Treponemataceae bacterium]